MAEQVKAWITSITGKQVNDLENDLKNGVVLCELVNTIRPGAIRQVNNYNSSYRQMQNIDNFLKVAEKVEVPAEDRFVAEDLHYGNNMDKVVLTLYLAAQKFHEKFGSAAIGSADVDSLREAATSGQKEGGKTRQKDSGLSIFDQTASKNQKESISGAFRTSDKIKKDHGQKAVPSSELGMVDSNARDKQSMISDAKSAGTDLIIKSKDGRSAVSNELGFIESDMSKKQKMISESKNSGQDKIVRSKDKALVSNELGMIDTDRSSKQKMISDAKARNMDQIVRSKDEAAVSSELGFVDSQANDKQKRTSEANKRMDKIVKGSNDGDVNI